MYCRGTLVSELGDEASKAANKEAVLQVLNGFRNAAAAKHMCGIVLELSMFGEHVSCKTQEEEAAAANRGGFFTSRRIHSGTQWCMPAEEAVVRALWLDTHWEYAADPLQ